MVNGRFKPELLSGFEWNEGNLTHVKKHSVNYRECEAVFFNKPLIVTPDLTHSQTESRFRVYGLTNKNRGLCLVVTIRNKKIRVISARDTSKREKKEFLSIGGDNK